MQQSVCIQFLTVQQIGIYLILKNHRLILGCICVLSGLYCHPFCADLNFPKIVQCHSLGQICFKQKIFFCIIYAQKRRESASIQKPQENDSLAFGANLFFEFHQHILALFNCLLNTRQDMRFTKIIRCKIGSKCIFDTPYNIVPCFRGTQLVVQAFFYMNMAISKPRMIPIHFV